MKIKSLIYISSIVLPLIAHAAIKQPINNSIKIIPMAQMDIPEDLKQTIQQSNQEQNTKGYHEVDNNYARFLLKMPRLAKQQIISFQNNNNPYDTHLKTSYTQIPLAFSFNKISVIKEKDIVGYAPIGSFVKETKNHTGWSGIKLFFTNEKLGSCAYSYFNLQLTHGSVQLNKDMTQYLINHKPTTFVIDGSYNSGFVYALNWYTPQSMHILECANVNFNQDLKNDLIKMANQIDKEINY